MLLEDVTTMKVETVTIVIEIGKGKVEIETGIETEIETGIVIGTGTGTGIATAAKKDVKRNVTVKRFVKGKKEEKENIVKKENGENVKKEKIGIETNVTTETVTVIVTVIETNVTTEIVTVTMDIGGNRSEVKEKTTTIVVKVEINLRRMHNLFNKIKKIKNQIVKQEITKVEKETWMEEEIHNNNNKDKGRGKVDVGMIVLEKETLTKIVKHDVHWQRNGQRKKQLVSKSK